MTTQLPTNKQYKQKALVTYAVCFGFLFFLAGCNIFASVNSMYAGDSAQKKMSEKIAIQQEINTLTIAKTNQQTIAQVELAAEQSGFFPVAQVVFVNTQSSALSLKDN